MGSYNGRQIGYTRTRVLYTTTTTTNGNAAMLMPKISRTTADWHGPEEPTE